MARAACAAKRPGAVAREAGGRGSGSGRRAGRAGQATRHAETAAQSRPDAHEREEEHEEPRPLTALDDVAHDEDRDGKRDRIPEEGEHPQESRPGAAVRAVPPRRCPPMAFSTDLVRAPPSPGFARRTKTIATSAPTPTPPNASAKGTRKTISLQRMSRSNTDCGRIVGIDPHGDGLAGGARAPRASRSPPGASRRCCPSRPPSTRPAGNRRTPVPREGVAVAALGADTWCRPRAARGFAGTPVDASPSRAPSPARGAPPGAWSRSPRRRTRPRPRRRGRRTGRGGRRRPFPRR